jgi:hypothetical protein
MLATPQVSAREIVTLEEDKVFLHDKARMRTSGYVWYLDIGASIHMTVDKAQFSELDLWYNREERFRSAMDQPLV